MVMNNSSKNIDFFSGVNLRWLSGMTLVEVVISLSIMALSAASVSAGFVFIQKASIQSAYYTGAQRVLQSHVERVMSRPTEQLVDETIVNYNYSGLRVTSASGEDAQEAITNTGVKPFIVFSNNLSLVAVPYTTNVFENAVLAYTTIIRVEENYPITNTFNAQTFVRVFRRATVTTYWINERGQTRSTSMSMIRAEN